MLRHVECCWIKFENGQIFHAGFEDVAWCYSRLARFVQQCSARPWALLRFLMSQHVVTGWPCNVVPNDVAIRSLKRYGSLGGLAKTAPYTELIRNKNLGGYEKRRKISFI